MGKEIQLEPGQRVKFRYNILGHTYEGVIREIHDRWVIIRVDESEDWPISAENILKVEES